MKVAALDGQKGQGRQLRLPGAVVTAQGMQHRGGRQPGADRKAQWHADALGAHQLAEGGVGGKETLQHRQLGIAGVEHEQQRLEAGVKRREGRAKSLALTQGEQLIEWQARQGARHRQGDLEQEAVLAAPVVIARLEQVQQAVEVVVIGDEHALVGQRPVARQPHREQVGQPARHQDAAGGGAGKTGLHAEVVQGFKAGLGRAEAVVVASLAPARDQLAVAKDLVALEVGGEQGLKLGDGRRSGAPKKVGAGGLAQQVAAPQALQRAVQFAALAHGEDKGEPLQPEQGEFQPELVPNLHARVVEKGLHDGVRCVREGCTITIRFRSGNFMGKRRPIG